MIDKIDEIIKRFVAVFLFPLINLIVIISITYVVTIPDTKRISSAAGEFLTFVIHAATGFIQTNTAAISEALHNAPALQGIASAFGVTLFFIVVISIYLLDRIVYYFGFFVPPNFQFDLESYEGKAAESRSSALSAIFGNRCDIAKGYGAIRAYLGQKNADQYRLNQRNKIVSGIETAKIVFAYTKAYFVYFGFMLAYPPGGAKISDLGAFETFVVLIVVIAVAIGYISFAYRNLIDYDLDSFIWERSYESALPIDISAVSKLIEDDPPVGWFARLLPIRLFRERLYLNVVFLDAEP